ncbi:MAG: hypothetical protein P4L69_05080 [Desulfosporosinus sp.]|nr:hypothetical protein [Desulfosporosinus sp.]
MYVVKRRAQGYKPIAHFKNELQILMDKSGLGPEYMDQVMALYPLVEKAYQQTPRFLYRAKIGTTAPKKAHPNNLPTKYLARQLLRLVGAPIKPPENGQRIRYAGTWRQICIQLNWADL